MQEFSRKTCCKRQTSASGGFGGFNAIYADIGPALCEQLTQAGFKTEYKEPPDLWSGPMSTGKINMEVFGVACDLDVYDGVEFFGKKHYAPTGKPLPLDGWNSRFNNADYNILNELQVGAVSYGVLGNPDIVVRPGEILVQVEPEGLEGKVLKTPTHGLHSPLLRHTSGLVQQLALGPQLSRPSGQRQDPFWHVVEPVLKDPGSIYK